MQKFHHTIHYSPSPRNRITLVATRMMYNVDSMFSVCTTSFAHKIKFVQPTSFAHKKSAKVKQMTMGFPRVSKNFWPPMRAPVFFSISIHWRLFMLCFVIESFCTEHDTSWTLSTKHMNRISLNKINRLHIHGKRSHLFLMLFFVLEKISTVHDPSLNVGQKPQEADEPS